MGRPALRAEQVEDFRDALCAAALRLFAEEGYDAVTLRALAHELGCSHALPYRYFSSKEDIFAAVRLRCFERFSRYHEGRLEGIEDPAEALRAMARGYVAFALEEPHVFRVMFDLAQPELSERPELRDAHRHAFRILERVVARAVALGALAGKPAELTTLFWASIHGVASLQLGGSFTPRTDPLALAERTAESLLAAHHPKQDVRRAAGRPGSP